MDKPESGLFKGNDASKASLPPRSARRAGPKWTSSFWMRFLITAAAIIYIASSYRAKLSSKIGHSLPGIFHGSDDAPTKPPNIVFIMTDDQDVRLGSLDRMDVLQNRLIQEGTNFINHYGTVALCCPGRATLFRGQAAHNTNITQVGGIGGGYTKWRRTGEWKSYLPHWLRQAGYTTAYFGKFLNGYGLHNYELVPEGWDWTDILTGPYIYNFQHVVTSENGEYPLYYEGWHQVDVLRLKALNRLEELTSQDKPFYLEVAPASPHVLPGGRPTVPPIRYNDTFPGLQVPRLPNYNPSDNYTKQKVAWLKDWPLMDQAVIDIADLAYQKRAEALLGVDDLINDILNLLENKGILDNTFVIYTSDNGFHLGQHRLAGGKGQPYVEDVNLPFVVRGPGISAGSVSQIPQTHVDIAPTLLEIAGLPKKLWPPFFDGRSLLQEWQSLTIPKDNLSREVLNVEFWGGTVVPAGPYTKHVPQNAYKSLRIVNETQGYLFNRWCYSNATDFYDTTVDPYELVNLAINPSNETVKLMHRLAGLLLVTKSCGQENCTQPWGVLRRHYEHQYNNTATFNTLSEARDPAYDSFFAGLPHFGFQECMKFQEADNEGPFLPESSKILGRQYREWLPASDGDVTWENNNTMLSASEHKRSAGIGNWKQRYGTFEDLERDTRPLTAEELGWPVVRCDDSNEWCGMEYDDD